MKKNALISSISALPLILASTAHADVIGIYASVDYWAYSNQTQVNNATATTPEKLDRDQAAQLSIAFEHPIPLVPNVKLKHVSLNSETEQQILATPYTQVELSNTDAILYYEILDNWISVDLGVGLKQLNGNIQYFTGDTIVQHQNQDIDDHYPIVYAAAGVALPLTSLSTKAEMTYSKFDDTNITDLQAEIKYDVIDNLLIDVGAKVGYRYLDIDMQKSPDAQLTFKGPYAGVEIHF